MMKDVIVELLIMAFFLLIGCLLFNGRGGCFIPIYNALSEKEQNTEIDFDKKGNWLEVDCKKSAVPEALIPVPVKEYVKANFPREIITKIERGRTGVEIELGNDYSLKFNKKGKFVSMDD